MSQNEPVSVRLLDREYTVGVEPSERASLTAAAQVLDSRMREIRGGNRTAGVDRIAVLAALNMAHELQMLREQLDARDTALQQALNALHRRLDRALDAEA